MPRRSNHFQKLITAIHGCIANDVHVEESALLVDKATGQEREVDVVIRSESGGYSIVLSIEVRESSRPLGSGWVEEMAAKHQDLPTNKLVLISKSGFTRPALLKARSRGIEAITVEEACKFDWVLGSGVAELRGILEQFVIKFKGSVHLAGIDRWVPADVRAKVILADGRSAHVRDIVDFSLTDPTGRDAMLQHFRVSQENSYHIIYTPPKGSVFEWSGSTYSLVKIAIDLRLTSRASPVELAFGRFRNREFVQAMSLESDSMVGLVIIKGGDGQLEVRVYNADAISSQRTTECQLSNTFSATGELDFNWHHD